MATCRDCKQEFEKYAHHNQCRACAAAWQRAYRAKNADSLRAKDRAKYAALRQNPEWVASERKRGREYWQQLRHEVMMAYGGYKCVCCGETEPMFLSIDHVFNDGAKHRRSLGSTTGNGKGANILNWLRDHGYPEGFQVLCMNCNHGKARNGGICPHEAQRSESKLREFGGSLVAGVLQGNTEPSREIGRCNDYPEREYAQVGGSAQAL